MFSVTLLFLFFSIMDIVGRMEIVQESLSLPTSAVVQMDFELFFCQTSFRSVWTNAGSLQKAEPFALHSDDPELLHRVNTTPIRQHRSHGFHSGQ